MEQTEYRLSEPVRGVSLTKDEIIQQRRIESSFAEYHPKNCMYCHASFEKSGVNLCASHSIPQFVLKNLGGTLKDSNSLVRLPWHHDTRGIKKAGVFYLLCRKCDGAIFQDYENSSLYDFGFNLDDSPKKQAILNEIAMKNCLHSLYDELDAAYLYEQAIPQIQDPVMHSKILHQYAIEQINVRDNRSYFSRIRYLQKRFNNGKAIGDEYSILYSHVFDRKFPIAFQGRFVVNFDCWGNNINNTFDLDSDLSGIHLCIFPFLDRTIVLAFFRTADVNLQRTAHSIQKIKDDNQVAKALLSMSIKASDNFYVAKDAPSRLFDNDYLRSLADDSGVIKTKSEVPLKSSDVVENIMKNRDITCHKLENYQRVPDSLIGL